MPLPMVNLISGGLHAGGNLDFQDFLLLPVGARSYSEALEMTVTVYRSLATTLRQAGYKTAAFYPPAVFFIDQDRFPHFEETHLGFEYAKVEFADPALRERQVSEFVAASPVVLPSLKGRNAHPKQ